MNVSHLARIFRENVNQLLSEKQISRNELSRRCGMHQPSIIKLLNSESEVQTDTIERIALALGVEAFELIHEHSHA